MQRIKVTFIFEGNEPIPNLHKCIYVRPNQSWSSFIHRRSEYKGLYESLQIVFPNNVLVSQFRGWSLVVCSIDIYTLERKRIFEHIDCVRLQQQVIHVYIFEYS